jgi:5'-nucleotidase
MSDGLSILLTNDDGIDAPGIASLREELTALGDVTVVAPDGNRSGVGRTRNDVAVAREHPWGYALGGTPADCVAYGLRGLGEEFDVVVSGVNDGPNAGNYVVGRSGTVGAGIEAAFLGTPALAVSAYHSTDFFLSPPEEYDFSRPARVARALVARALDADVYDDVDLLNVNAPVDSPSPPVILTEPYHDYEQHVERSVDPDGDEYDLAEDEHLVRLSDRTWPGVVGWENPFPPTEEHRDRYPLGTDRRAMVDAAVSVSPLSVSHGVADSPHLADVVETLDVQ